MLANNKSIDLMDLGTPAIIYLTLEPANPAGWTALFGVTAQPSANPLWFDLEVVYDPAAGGVGVTLPVAVESFTNLSLGTVEGQVDGSSKLITVESFAQTAASSLSASALMTFDPTEAVPVITLAGTLDSHTETWNPVRDLLESEKSDLNFVVEVESDGTAILRFGDDTNGRFPESGTEFVAKYRIGNGAAGNVGVDSLIFLSTADARIQSCRNPLPASGGIDPETNDQIRRRAPQAFLTQERAVTMADYEAVAQQSAEVDRAVASLRWTGSWYTVFVAVEPRGGGNLPLALEQKLVSLEERFRLAGQDLELVSPQYLSLQIDLEICVDPDYFQSDVRQALLAVLGNQVLPNGQKGLFFPDNFTFGQAVYLSPVYAAARSVAGVRAVRAVHFQPQGASSVDADRYLAAGEIKLGPLQIARLENNRNFPDHGRLTLVMEGGK